MKRYLCYKTLLIVIGAICLNSCKKPAVGYLSDNVFYQVSNLVASQGVTTYSSSMQLNGSSSPMTVTLIGARNAATGEDVLDSLTKGRSIVTYLGTITKADTTVESLTKNLTTALKPALHVNSIGGRIELSAATSFIGAGTYELDVQVTNSAGTKIIKNACQITLQPVADPFVLVYRFMRYYNTTTAVYTDADGEMKVDIKYSPGEETHVNLKFMDKNGAYFNPSTGEAKRRSTTYPSLRDWTPYYPEVRSSTAFEYRIPSIGVAFPFFDTVTPGGSTWVDAGGSLSYYRLDSGATSNGQECRVTLSFKFLAAGTYDITCQMTGITRK